MEKVATVTVTYNRKELLIENIKQLLTQTYKIDAIIIIDNNSTDNTKQRVFEEFGKNTNIEYIYLEENIGGAGGFYTGCKYAYEKGYDWVILMDDDGRPQDNRTIENLMKGVKEKGLTKNDKIMFNSLVMCNERQLSFGLFDSEDTIDKIKEKAKGNIIDGYISPFNGTLVSRNLMKEIGFPNKDFFIKGDERDYLRRARSDNAYIATVVNSLYYHPRCIEKNLKELKIHKKKYRLYTEKPWKEYYRVRNHVYTYTNLNEKKEAMHIVKIKLLSAMLCKCNKIQTIKMIIKGYKDGKNGKMGNTVKPK